jgi:hypothetical protein
MKNLIFLLLFISQSFFALAQDTVRVMQYNLMQYSTSPYGTCTSYNNNIANKAANLKTIVNYVKPTIITVVELGNTQTHVNHVLTNVLNTNGATWWKSGQLTCASGGTLSNMMFYDSRKFTLKSSDFVQTAVRDFNIYRLYYNTPDLTQGDTSYLITIIGHLKAGTTDSVARNTQVGALMSRLNSWNVADNYILCGDFNVYSSSESCYKQLLNYSNPLVRFYDPINKPGDWNNNYQFASYHTQSTHSSSTDSCFSSGGLDDRFDFILTSSNVLNGYNKVKALPSTYHAVGQDGNRYNGTIISPTNNSIPSAVATALFNMSDHLPLVMDFLVYYPSHTGIQNNVSNGLSVNLQNPVNEELKFKFSSSKLTSALLSIFDINGRVVLQQKITQTSIDEQFEIPVQQLQSGTYLLRLTTNQGFVVSRFVKL